jgi:hypothetical protein
MTEPPVELSAERLEDAIAADRARHRHNPRPTPTFRRDHGQRVNDLRVEIAVTAPVGSSAIASMTR